MRIERIDESVFLVLTPFGTVRVSDGNQYRSYYIDNPASKELALALSLLGVNVADCDREIIGRRVDEEGHQVGTALNGTKIVIHCSKGRRARIERSLDEIFHIDEENWRKA